MKPKTRSNFIIENKKNTSQFIILLLFLFSSSFLNAQKKIKSAEVFQEPTLKSAENPSCTSNSEAYKKKYQLQSFYIPKPNDQVITLKITVHVFKPIADTGRWQMNDNNFNGLPALKYLFDSITNDHQERFSVKRNASYEIKNFKSTYIYDSKIRYEITNIYFYPNLELYLWDNDAALFEYIEKTDPARINEGMPIVFNGGNGPGHLSSYKGASALVTTIHAFDLIFGRSHLLHEIGHAFGLGHTYANSATGGGSEWQNFNAGCGSIDYLSDVFPNNNPTCQNEGKETYKPSNAPCYSCYESTPDTSNNLMGGHRYNLWMSPLQMGRRIRSMHLNSNNGHNIRQFAKDIESDHNNVWTIKENEIWDFDIQMYNDIVVKEGATLTVKCKISMAIDGKIKLEKGAHLIIDGGEITGWCKSDDWQGIQTKKIKNKKNTTVVIPAVKFSNGGLISRAKIPINEN